MILYHNKNKSWKHISMRVETYQKHLFFKVNKSGFKSRKTKTRTLPKHHAMINFFLFSYWRDNSNFRLGVGLGKKQLSVNFHCMF